MKRMLMLGAGACQFSGIEKIKAMGHQVVVADPNPHSPGKKIADEKVTADLFLKESVFEKIKNLNIDGVMTTGTDQPVLTSAYLAEKLGLPQFLSAEKALWVTHKKYMKRIFSKEGIPTLPYALIGADFEAKEIAHMPPPYVMKPLDSQGQRGVFKLESEAEIRQKLPESLSFSREKEVLVEPYYKNEEVTVTGWVRKGALKILAMTDRISVEKGIHIGVCTAHEYPSKHQEKYGEKVAQITKDICSAFGIWEGPIYFQYLIGEEGVFANEIAARIGGAYEDVTMPYLTGVDILKMQIEGAFFGDYDDKSWQGFKRAKETCFSVELLFCRPGIIHKMSADWEIKSLPFVLDAGFHFGPGKAIEDFQNASLRFGYAIVTGENKETLEKNIQTLYQTLYVVDRQNHSLIIERK